MAEDKKPTTNKTTKAKTTKKESPAIYTTQTGHPLTVNEENFIQEYIKTSNKKKAYELAYDNANPKTSAQNAQIVFNKPYINEEIGFRLQALKSESIAEADEIFQYFTSVMRGEIKDQFGLEAPLSERTKAAQELAKRKIDMLQKLEGGNDGAPEVRIVLDWGMRADATTTGSV